MEFYYAALDENSIVTGIRALSGEVNCDNYIRIPEPDETLHGAIFDPETGEFTRMSHYAIIDDNSIIQDALTQRSTDAPPLGAVPMAFDAKSFIGSKCLGGEIVLPNPVEERLECIEQMLTDIMAALQLAPMPQLSQAQK